MSLRTETVSEAISENSEAAADRRIGEDKYAIRLPRDPGQRTQWASRTIEEDRRHERTQSGLGWVCLTGLVVCTGLFLAVNFIGDLVPAPLKEYAWAVYTACLLACLITVVGTVLIAGRRPTGVALANARYFAGQIDAEQAAEQIRQAEEMKA